MEKNKPAKSNVLCFFLAYICLGLACVGVTYIFNSVLVYLIQLSPTMYFIIHLIFLVFLCIVLYKVTDKMDRYFNKIKFVKYGRWISISIVIILLIVIKMLEYL